MDKGVISVKVERKHNSILLEIRDTGCGIEREHIAHVTDPFTAWLSLCGIPTCYVFI